MLPSPVYLKVQAANSSETVAVVCQTMYSCKPDDRNPNHHCRQNLKFHTAIVKGKGKNAPVHALKACRGNRGIAPLILDSAVVGG